MPAALEGHGRPHKNLEQSADVILPATTVVGGRNRFYISTPFVVRLEGDCAVVVFEAAGLPHMPLP